MNTKWTIAFTAAATALASAQDFSIFTIAPDAVPSGATYTVEVWGSVTGAPWVDGVSAMAAFAIDMLATKGAAGVQEVGQTVFPEWCSNLGVHGTINGAHIIGISGGQLANIQGFNPDIDLSNPILLFTFDVTTDPTFGGRIAYTPGNPDPDGGLVFFPDSHHADHITAPNDPGTHFHLVGATTHVLIPAPASIALLGLGGIVSRRRR